MYSVVLMMAMASAQEAPQGILFNRGAGCGGAQAVASAGCGGARAGFFHGRQRRHIFPLFGRRSSGCGGGQAGYAIEATATYKRMPVGPVTAPVPAEKMPAPSKTTFDTFPSPTAGYRWVTICDAHGCRRVLMPM